MITKKKQKFTETAGATGKESPNDLLQFILDEKAELIFNKTELFDWSIDPKVSIEANAEEVTQDIQSPMTDREDKGSW